VKRGAVWKLTLDLWSAKVIVWAASVGRDAVLTREAHLYFFDRYTRLAGEHRVRGHIRKAARLEQTAEEHLQDAGGDGPPYAAAMAMPRPRAFVRVNAVGSVRNEDSDDAA
jgi:hypothetical protein